MSEIIKSKLKKHKRRLKNYLARIFLKIELLVMLFLAMYLE